LFNVDCSQILVDEEALIDYEKEYKVAKAIREFDVPVAVLSDSLNLSFEAASLDLNVSLVLSKNLHPDAMALKLIDFINQDKSNLSGNSHEVNDQTNQFLAHIGHEIRTPLNGILGTAELLSNLNLPPLQASYVNTIKSSGNTLLLVLNDLLDFIRIQAKRVEFENVAFSIRDLIQDSFELFGALSCKQGTDLLLDIHDGVPLAIYGDPGRLKQIFNNLISNALKYTHSGQVEVSVKRVDQRSMIVEVRDNGEGVAAGKRKNLFEPFSQGAPALLSNYAGSGLGLSICKNLVELMSGKIGYRPSSPKGSVFWFEIPMVRSDILISRPLPLLSGSVFYVLSENFKKESWEQLLRHEGASIGQIESAPIDWARSLFLIDQNRMAHPLDPAVKSVLSNPSSRVIVAGFSEGPMGQKDSGWGVDLSSFDSQLSCVSGEEEIFSKRNSYRYIPKPLRPQLIASAVNSFKEAEASHFNGLRVLVVDDNEANILVATRMLESIGCRPFSVNSAREFRKLVSGETSSQDVLSQDSVSEAVESCDRPAIDLIFMDCNLVDAKGYELAKEIRSRADRLGRVPIIGLTASKWSEDLESCIKSGMNAVLQKPISIAELRNSMETFVLSDLAQKI
jgi:signal transduction histidine kinase/FixJ family two-component response regulator